MISFSLLTRREWDRDRDWDSEVRLGRSGESLLALLPVNDGPNGIEVSGLGSLVIQVERVPISPSSSSVPVADEGKKSER